MVLIPTYNGREFESIRNIVLVYYLEVPKYITLPVRRQIKERFRV